jgi:hypothetical protein
MGPVKSVLCYDYTISNWLQLKVQHSGALTPSLIDSSMPMQGIR